MGRAAEYFRRGRREHRWCLLRFLVAGERTAPVGAVNGVTVNGNDLEITSSGFAGSGAVFGTHTTADATYNGLLQYGTWSNGTSASFTLNGTGHRSFTPGRQYLVQVWVSDARANGNGRTETVGGSGSLSYKTGSGMGQYVIGRFTADAASQAISLSANASAQVNLVQVRDITPPESMTRHERFKTLKYGIFSHYVWAGDWGMPDIYGVAPTSADDVGEQVQRGAVCQRRGAGGGAVCGVHGVARQQPSALAEPDHGEMGAVGGPVRRPRDVISDMIDAVKAKGIRVFLYTHPWQPVRCDDHNTFINELYAETIDRYGSRIDGLWIDENQINSDQDSVVDYTRLMATIKSHNPDLVTMQNGWQLYTAETGGNETVGYWNFGQSQPMYN